MSFFRGSTGNDELREGVEALRRTLAQLSATEGPNASALNCINHLIHELEGVMNNEESANRAAGPRYN